LASAKSTRSSEGASGALLGRRSSASTRRIRQPAVTARGLKRTCSSALALVTVTSVTPGATCKAVSMQRAIARDQGMVGDEPPGRAAWDFEQRDDICVAMEGDRLAGPPGWQHGVVQLLVAAGDGVGEPAQKDSSITV